MSENTKAAGARRYFASASYDGEYREGVRNEIEAWKRKKAEQDRIEAAAKAAAVVLAGE